MTAPVLVDCPACGGEGETRISPYHRPSKCQPCEGLGELPPEYADEWLRNHAEMTEMADDDRAHAWRERRDEDRGE